MFQHYIHNLIRTVPTGRFAQDGNKYDLVLDGGMFNGSYQIGCLYFLRELQNQGKVIIERFSGCSIGALAAVLYQLDRLDLAKEGYEFVLSHVKSDMNLAKFHAFLDDRIGPILPATFHQEMTNRLFVCFYDVKSQNKIIKTRFRSNKAVMDALKCTMFVPFFFNGDNAYRDKYMDGMNPYILPLCNNKGLIYIDLFDAEKWINSVRIKNEKTNSHRLIVGILDMHTFFFTGENTPMCSLVNKWSVFHTLKNRILRPRFETCLVWSVYSIILLRDILPPLEKGSPIEQLWAKVFRSLVEFFFI